ncbi:Spc24 subunit of Ndc80-domain-containing protein [Chytriomyces sp. MP71]|nr:Spc24 subunit of Ndc80-domain-containing protein [Chytriomyces sp. MP71]
MNDNLHMLTSASAHSHLPRRSSGGGEVVEGESEASVHAIEVTQLLPSLLEQLSVDDDAATLRDTAAACERLRALRATQGRDAIESLRKLSRELEAAKRLQEVAQTEHADKRRAYQGRVAHLEEQKYGIAKKIHEKEKAIAMLDARKRELLAELEEVKALEEKECARPPEESVLKLSIYKSLGIDLVYEDEKPVRALVRSVDKNDIQVLELDPKFSRFYYANQPPARTMAGSKKRSAQNDESVGAKRDAAAGDAAAAVHRRNAADVDDEGMGEFEDAFVDEFDDDEDGDVVVVDGDDEDAGA